MKAIIVISDDLIEIDRTEITYQSKAQLRAIVSSALQDTPDAEIAEVYDAATKSLMTTYRLKRDGTLIDCSKALTTAPQPKPRKPRDWSYKYKSPEDKMSHQIFINVTEKVNDFLHQTLGRKRNQFVRDAIQEKFDREGVEAHITPPKPEHPDRRYHRMFKKLPPSIKTYDGREMYLSALTIIKSDKDIWQVSYGTYTTDDGAPSIANEDLLYCLEWMDKWLEKYNKKWVVGKVIKKDNSQEIIKFIQSQETFG